MQYWYCNALGISESLTLLSCMIPDFHFVLIDETWCVFLSADVSASLRRSRPVSAVRR